MRIFTVQKRFPSFAPFHLEFILDRFGEISFPRFSRLCNLALVNIPQSFSRDNPYEGIYYLAGSGAVAATARKKTVSPRVTTRLNSEIGLV